VGFYITVEALEDRLSQAVVRRIYDDDNDGEPDAGPLLRVIKDAERRFESIMKAVYPSLAVLRATDSAESVSGLVLDLAEAIAAKRFPRCVCREWKPLLDDALAQIKEYRTGVAQAPIDGSPNPPANTGGQVEVFGPHCVATDNEPVFNNGTGIF
jgi:hypothetical protein